MAPDSFAQTANDISVVNMTVEEALLIIAEMEATLNGGGAPDGD